jgi:hypothetical protein
MVARWLQDNDTTHRTVRSGMNHVSMLALRPPTAAYLRLRVFSRVSWSM